jgi:hypothetical protein
LADILKKSILYWAYFSSYKGKQKVELKNFKILKNKKKRTLMRNKGEPARSIMSHSMIRRYHLIFEKSNSFYFIFPLGTTNVLFFLNFLFCCFFFLNEG